MHAVVAHGAAGGLDHDGGDVARGQGFVDRVRIGFRQHRDRGAGRIGDAGGRVAAGAAGDVVVPAVEVVGEGDDAVTAGSRACDADGHHRRLGAGAVKADALDRRHQRPHCARPGDLLLGVGAELRAVGELGGGGGHQLGVAVAEQQCAVPHHVVDVFAAVDVPLQGAGGAGHEDRERQDTAYVMRGAAGKHVQRLPEELRGARMELDVLARDRVGCSERRTSHGRTVGLSAPAVQRSPTGITDLNRSAWRSRYLQYAAISIILVR